MHALKFWCVRIIVLSFCCLVFLLGFLFPSTQFTRSACNWLHRARGLKSYRVVEQACGRGWTLREHHTMAMSMMKSISEFEIVMW